MELNSFYDLYANNLITNLLLMISATLVAYILAFLLPIVDYKLSNKVGLNLQGGLSIGRRATFFKLLRKGSLLLAFLIYMLVLIYLVILARTPNPDYLVRNAGVSLFTMAAKGNFVPEVEFLEFYLNMMVFIPMGYLLPYIFRWFRIHAVRRPLIFCFLASVTIENLQLITKRGSYDTADVLSNTLGGIIGIALFVRRAYRLTNPEWKKDNKNYLRWRRLAKKGVLFPFIRKSNVRRVTVLVRNEENTWDFYAKKLGFQLIKLMVPDDSKACSFLFRAGRTQIEIRCLNDENGVIPEKQIITLSNEDLDRIKAKLEKTDVEFEAFGIDEYTNHRTLTIKAPEGVDIVLLEL